MNLCEHYAELYADSIEKIKKGKSQIDPLIDSREDKRRGISLILRPSEEIKERMRYFQNRIREIEPEQYFQPFSDIHVTVLSIISCYEGFDLSLIDVSRYKEIIDISFNEFSSVTLSFSGISASCSCIMACGYPDSDLINLFRENLRDNFCTSGLENSIDSRYRLETAHSSLIRFRKPISKVDELCAAFQEFERYDFGTFTADNIEFVYNDWYQRQKSGKILGRFVFK